MTRTGSAEVDLVHYFFFQAEDGIRDHCVTGVQTCALPICGHALSPSHHRRRNRLRGRDGLREMAGGDRGRLEPPLSARSLRVAFDEGGIAVGSEYADQQPSRNFPLTLEL